MYLLTIIKERTTKLMNFCVKASSIYLKRKKRGKLILLVSDGSEGYIDNAGGG